MQTMSSRNIRIFIYYFVYFISRNKTISTGFLANCALHGILEPSSLVRHHLASCEAGGRGEGSVKRNVSITLGDKSHTHTHTKYSRNLC